MSLTSFASPRRLQRASSARISCSRSSWEKSTRCRLEWGRQQPHTLATKQEIVRRYGQALQDAAPLFRFMQENQATVRELSVGQVQPHGLLIVAARRL